MKSCTIPAGEFEELIIEGVRFAINAPDKIEFNASDDFSRVEIDSWQIEQLEIVCVDAEGTDIAVPKRLFDSPIVNGGKPWVVAILEAACELAEEKGMWDE